jgi:hypothetical protein
MQSKLKIDAWGHKRWINNEHKKFHREDGPACEYNDGSKTWFLKGRLHRLDGPAKDWADGTKMWYVDGQQYSEKQFPIAVIMFLLDCNEEIANMVLCILKQSFKC